MILSSSSQENRGSYWNIQTRVFICQVRGTLNKLIVLCDGPCRVTPDGSTLNISRALTSDTGKYTCVATNSAGEEDRIFNLNVYGEFCQMWNPSLLHHPILVSASRGEHREECLSALESCMHVFSNFLCCRYYTGCSVNDKRVEIAGKCVSRASFNTFLSII